MLWLMPETAAVPAVVVPPAPIEATATVTRLASAAGNHSVASWALQHRRGFYRVATQYAAAALKE